MSAYDVELSTCGTSTQYGEEVEFVEVVEAWIEPGDTSHLNLRLDGTPTCRELEDFPSRAYQAGLMLVYTDFTGPGRLHDASDEPLGELGPEWMSVVWERCVGYDGGSPSYCWEQLHGRHEGSLPGLDSLVPIPCPGEA